MAFEPQATLIPTSIGRIDHFLDDPDEINRSFKYSLQILDQLGDVMKNRYGSEVPHTTTTQRNQLITFMNNRRAALPVNLNLPAGHTLGRLIWRMRDLDGTTGGRSIYCRAVEFDELAQFIQVRIFDEQPFLSGAQINAILTFLTAQRTKAVDEIL